MKGRRVHDGITNGSDKVPSFCDSCASLQRHPKGAIQIRVLNFWLRPDALSCTDTPSASVFLGVGLLCAGSCAVLLCCQLVLPVSSRAQHPSPPTPSPSSCAVSLSLLSRLLHQHSFPCNQHSDLICRSAAYRKPRATSFDNITDRDLFHTLLHSRPSCSQTGSVSARLSSLAPDSDITTTCAEPLLVIAEAVIIKVCTVPLWPTCTCSLLLFFI